MADAKNDREKQADSEEQHQQGREITEARVRVEEVEPFDDAEDGPLRPDAKIVEALTRLAGAIVAVATSQRRLKFSNGIRK